MRKKKPLGGERASVVVFEGQLLLPPWARHSLLKNPLSLNFSVGSSSSSEDPLLSLSLLLSLLLSRRRDFDFLLFFSFFFSFFLFFSFFFLLFFSFFTFPLFTPSQTPLPVALELLAERQGLAFGQLRRRRELSLALLLALLELVVTQARLRERFQVLLLPRGRVEGRVDAAVRGPRGRRGTLVPIVPAPEAQEVTALALHCDRRGKSAGR